MKDYTPSKEVTTAWPGVSGNDINQVGEKSKSRPHPVFWRDDLDSFPHGAVQGVFWERSFKSELLMGAWARRQEILEMPISDVASEKQEATAEEWTEQIKSVALDAGAIDVGICEYRGEWTFDDRPVPKGKYAIVLVVAHDYDKLATAPDEVALTEVVDQYGAAAKVCKILASWIREHGWEADAKTGPRTEDVLMIPAAIEAGVGELGKHGSLLSRKEGANTRLSMVLTDVPLIVDKPEPFGGDLFCQSCQVCVNVCPVDAIAQDKQWVRGDFKWYVDFDKCVPYFVDNQGCGICIAKCPWSRPGVASGLLVKMAKKLEAEKSGRAE